MSKEITILANSTRDQEGYSDTQMGVSLDIECELPDVGLFIIELRKLDNELKKLYPPYSKSEIEPDITYRDAPNCYMFYRFDFSRIQNNQSSTLHNISSLMSAYASYRVAEVFINLGYTIVSDNKLTISNKEASHSICEDQFNSFLWFVSDSLYEIDHIEYNDNNKKEFLAQFEDKEFYKLAMKTLSNEEAGEFGFSDPMDKTIPFKEYSPYTISQENSEIISDLCQNIKYSELLEFFNKNIR